MEPEVLAELVERHKPEVLETSGPGTPAAAVEAGTVAAAAGTAGVAGTTAAADTAGRLEARTGVAAGSNWSDLPLLILHLPVLALRVERAVNQMVEVVEVEVEQRVLEVLPLHEVLLLVAVIRDLGRGVASELKEMITILRDHHSPLKWKKKDV